MIRYESEPYEYTTGGIAVNVRVSVFFRGTTAHVPIYLDNGVTQAPNPLRTDAAGRVEFYIAPGSYDLYANGVRTQIEVTSSAPGTTFNRTHSHDQPVAMGTWTITHDLSPRPTVDVVIEGELVFAGIEYPDDTHVVIVFDSPKAGKAELRG